MRALAVAGALATIVLLPGIIVVVLMLHGPEVFA